MSDSMINYAYRYFVVAILLHSACSYFSHSVLYPALKCSYNIVLRFEDYSPLHSNVQLIAYSNC